MSDTQPAKVVYIAFPRAVIHVPMWPVAATAKALGRAFGLPSLYLWGKSRSFRSWRRDRAYVKEVAT